VIRYLIAQDFAQRFSGNILGLAWALVAPVLQLALFAFVFVLIFKARVPGLDGLGYVVYLSMGMWPWFAFSDAVARGTTAITDQASLLAKVAIAPWQLIAARVAGGFILHGIGFIAVLLLLWIGSPHLQPAYLPLTLLAWAALAALALALAMIFAIIHVFVRDLQQIVVYGLTAAMFLTPILYAADLGPPELQALQRFNPFADAIFGIRNPLMSGDLGHALPITTLACAGMGLLVATWLYRRFRPHLLDFL